MLLYEDVISKNQFLNLSRQKLEFKKNDLSSLKKCQVRYHKYMRDENFRQVLDLYIKAVSKDIPTNVDIKFYRSKQSEAYYLTFIISTFKKKLRIANHDTVEGADYDECIWLHECASMKTLTRGILRFIDQCILEWRSKVTIDDFSIYFNKSIQILSDYETNIKVRDNAINKKSEYENKLKSLLDTYKIYEDAIGYLKEIIELISRQHISHIEKLLDSAVKTIFYDKNYSIKMEISEYKNTNSLNIFLVETTDEGEIKTDIKNNGFGLQGIVGFVLQVYFILYHKLSPILVMDEAMSTLSTQYLPYLKELMDVMSKKYSFIFVLVAHDPRWIDLADYKYEIQNGEVKEVK